MDEFIKQFLETQARIATALETIAARETTTVGAITVTATPEAAAKVVEKAPVEKTPAKAEVVETPAEPEAPAGPTYTIDEVRAALKEYRAIEGNVAMLEVLKTHGGGKESLPEIDAKHFPAIMDAVGASK